MLTLPPEVGNRYLYRRGTKKEQREPLLSCVIVREHGSTSYTKKQVTTYESHGENGDNWTFWPDGTAKVGSGRYQYVAYLVEDVLMEDDQLEQLQEQRKAMQQRLKELGL